jgi:hypothetical protein
MIPLLFLMPDSATLATKPGAAPHDRYDTKAHFLRSSMLFWGTAINSMWPFLFYIGK